MQKYEVFLISGGTGFIGTALIEKLLQNNCKIYVLTRSPKISNHNKLEYIVWNPTTKKIEKNILEKNICVIHLAGANVALHRWSSSFKTEIIESRLESTNFIWELINSNNVNASYFVGASATGYYGENKNTKIAFTENDESPKNNFLAETCKAWEDATHKNNINNIPCCIFRIGMVLGANGGAVPKFLKSITFKIAGVPGNGKQYYPWVHINDVINAIIYATNKNLNSTYNLVSPQIETAKNIITTLAKCSTKYFITLPSPSFIIKILLGSFSTEVLKSVNVSCNKLLQTGFQFQYSNLIDACKNIINTIKKAP